MLYQFIFGLTFGAVIACSPTKFSSTTSPDSLCDKSVASCIVEQGILNITQNFEVGSGKVDILFISDNSASMSVIQAAIAQKFSGFIQNLDNKKIDYHVAITTTDVESVKTKKLTTFANGLTYLSNSDSNRINYFSAAIVRTDTIACESFIGGMFNTYGTSFQSRTDYGTGYLTNCASPDTRGIYTGNLVVSENADSFIRTDANLNIILISNDDVRQGRYLNDASYALADTDKSQTFTAMMAQKYPNKYWDFNSIIVKDNICKQSQTLKNYQGVVITNEQNLPAVSGGIGTEYANLSNSAAVDIDNNPRSRGQILDICQSSYSQNFDLMATQITEAARLFSMKCTPLSAPTVERSSNPSLSVPFHWDGADKIVFQRGSEGIPVTVKYRCYTGAK
ncbi:MAG: hypothetical protein WA160_04805 [Pseudobdellovibrio sp.]